LQETHAIDATVQAELNLLFNSSSTLWTPHCGIVSLKPHFQIVAHSTFIHEEGRFLCATVHSSISPSTPLLQLLNIYAPAYSTPRKAFYQQLANNLDLMSHLQSSNIPTLILGDFNFNPFQRSTITDTWLELLDLYYSDCFGDDPRPTFTAHSNNRTRIDFILCSSQHRLLVTSHSQHFISSTWTDHDLLSITLRPPLETAGPGLWKADPSLARIPSFRDGLTKYIESRLTSQNFLDENCPHSAQVIWDILKTEVKIYTKSFQYETNKWRTKTLKKYQSCCEMKRE
ncbi:uncharacterized protein B0P05DRAFT_468306, partial [Gilbertella persicaria]|uniref:uncharacterized protein n=1 Tax=Gilbertella persicaria TaxID=101096 RepID=UPI0022212AE2